MAFKVRTVTAGVSLSPGTADDWRAAIQPLLTVLQTAKTALEAAGYVVQTTRLVTNSFQVRGFL